MLLPLGTRCNHTDAEQASSTQPSLPPCAFHGIFAATLAMTSRGHASGQFGKFLGALTLQRRQFQHLLDVSRAHRLLQI